jgi:Mrp family chromosome partitioning ATPase
LLPESRRALCEELYSSAVSGCTVVAIAGPIDAGDEKSRVAAELSLALAESGHTRVLLLEGNLRRPQSHRFLRVAMPRGSGLSQQLRSRTTHAGRAPWTVIECSQSLHALCESETPIPELILSQTFEDCVKELRRFYDLIVIDGPFTSDVPACRAVEDVIDSAIFVHLRSKTREAAEAGALFPGKRVSWIAAAG